MKELFELAIEEFMKHDTGEKYPMGNPQLWSGSRATTKDFVKHGHKASEADIVVCCLKDLELDPRIKVVTLNHLFISFWDEVYPMIDPSRRLYSPDELRDVVDMWNKKKPRQ